MPSSCILLGDADRVAFFSATGQHINCSIIGAMIAKNLLLQQQREHPDIQLTFIYNVFTSRIYEETIQKYGGRCEISRVGHAFVKEKMRVHDAVFSCENSGHFYFRDNYYADSGVLCFMQLVSALSSALMENGNLTFVELFQEFMVYHQTEEKLVYVPDKSRGLALIEQVYRAYSSSAPTKVTLFDGVSVQVFMPTPAEKGYWFTVKDSVTEDALKFVVESEDVEIADIVKLEILQLLESME